MNTSDDLNTLTNPHAQLDERISAARSLSGRRDAQTIAALLQAASTTNEELRDAAIASLAKLGAAEQFARTLHDAKSSVEARVEAANGLRLLRNPKTVTALAAGLRDKDENVRAASAHALAVHGATAALAPLKTALEDASTDVRYFAVLALEQVPSAREALEQRLAVEQDSIVLDELERVLEAK